VATPLKPDNGRSLGIPPQDVIYLEVQQAKIPALTRDGRKWDSIGGTAPDPFVIVFLDNKELLRTPVQSNTLEPNWPDQPRGNYRIPLASKLRVEMWDSNPMNNYPICSKWLAGVHSQVLAGEAKLDLRCESGAQLNFLVAQAHPSVGLGFFYELLTGRVNITRVYSESPAAKAGVLAGDRVLEIMGKKVSDMEDGEAQSLINSNAQAGVRLRLRHRDGREAIVDVKEGAVYPLVKELGRRAGTSG
jgi:hypothetical protein